MKLYEVIEIRTGGGLTHVNQRWYYTARHQATGQFVELKRAALDEVKKRQADTPHAWNEVTPSYQIGVYQVELKTTLVAADWCDLLQGHVLLVLILLPLEQILFLLLP